MSAQLQLNTDQLPIRDKYCTYNYTRGEERVTLAARDRIKFIRYFAHDPRGYVNQNYLMCNLDNQVQSHVKLLPKDQTIQFALESIQKWGVIDAEKVLSATPTGSLYFNILHHFGSYYHFAAEQGYFLDVKSKLN